MRIKDIAEMAGVSTATVSRVLNGKQHVRPQVRERVLEVAGRLNYSPNRAAQSLRLRTSNMIGLIVADIQNPFFASVCRAVEDVAQTHDYSVLLCNSDENPEKEAMYLKLLQNENMAGVILAPTGRLARSFPHEIVQQIPMVVIDREVEGGEIDSVLIDNFAAAKQLTNHLLTQGSRRIAGLFGSGSITGEKRQEGFRAAFAEHGIEPEEELIIGLPARMEDGWRMTRELLEGNSPPQAVLTGNGLLAAGAFQAIREQELEIPDQIAFATFDETPWTAMTRPAITVIRQPTYAIGQTAGEMLFKRIEDSSRPVRKVVLSCNLVTRQSCGVEKRCSVKRNVAQAA